MTPVQLPEVPAIQRYTVSGDIAYPIHEDVDGDYVSYDDHAAQLREYAAEAVIAERRRILGDWEFRWQIEGDDSLLLISHPEHGGVGVWKDDESPRICTGPILYELGRFLLTIPSETNSER